MRLALIGVGLIGGSFAAALRSAGEVEEIIGFDVDASAAARGVKAGIIDRVAGSPADTARGADLVVISVPVGAMRTTFAALGDLSERAVITDVGSTKVSVIEDARAVLGATFRRFVPAHPIAGGERPGIEHAEAGLFRQRLAITTPVEDTDPDALAAVERLWRATGARIERLEPTTHDRIFAAVSHLPHLLAFALVDQIARAPEAALKLGHAGAGFRDFTRIAASSPEMWRDICIANRDALLKELDDYRDRLAGLRDALAQGDGALLEAVFRTASNARRGNALIDAGAGTLDRSD